MSKLKIENEISCCPVLEDTGLALAELLPLFPDRLFCALALNYFVNRPHFCSIANRFSIPNYKLTSALDVYHPARGLTSSDISAGVSSGRSLIENKRKEFPRQRSHRKGSENAQLQFF
jgi:hypothetical protein